MNKSRCLKESAVTNFYHLRHCLTNATDKIRWNVHIDLSRNAD
jgi:hypothetical protein